MRLVLQIASHLHRNICRSFVLFWKRVRCPHYVAQALLMCVQAHCQKIGAWPTPVTAGGAKVAAAKAALCPSAARVRCAGGSIQLRFNILLCASYKRIVLKHSAAQVIVVMLGGGNWAEEAQVNGNHGRALLCFGRINRPSSASDASITPHPSGSTGSLKACIRLQKDGPSAQRKIVFCTRAVIIVFQVLYCASELLSPQQFLEEMQAAGKAMPT